MAYALGRCENMISKGVKLALAHLFGDYILQTHWMATQKTERWSPAVVHGLVYGLCHLPVTRHPAKLAVIAGTHIVLDHYRLAKQLSWAKNQLAPKEYRYDFDENVAGYPPGTPPWLATWLMIITDNTIHLGINTLATKDD